MVAESIQRKSSFRDTFLNMLGEFVALNKTPDFKPNTQSNQYLADAIRDEIEKQKKRTNTFGQLANECGPMHLRTSSTISAYQKPSKKYDTEKNDAEPRRHSIPGYSKENENNAARPSVSRSQRFLNRLLR